MSHSLRVPSLSRSQPGLGFRTTSYHSRARGTSRRLRWTETAEADPVARPPTQRLLVTPEEAAEWLSVGRGRIYALFRTNELASVQIGRSRRIPVSALEAYVRALEESARQTDATAGLPE